MLPGSVRKQVSLAYLFCRVADTVADTYLPLLSAVTNFASLPQAILLTTPSLMISNNLRAALLPQRTPQEAYQLLYHLPVYFHLFVRLSAVDRQLVRELVLILTHGMEMDLQYFPGETPSTVQPLPDLAILDLYTYYGRG